MEEEKKKTTFLFVFLTYLPVFLHKFRLGEIIGCRIKFHIQRVPTRYTFDVPRYPKNKKYLKKQNDDVIISFFQVFLVLGVEGPSKVCQVGTRWMQNLIPYPMSSPDLNLSKRTRRYVENTNKKSSFFMIPIPKVILKKCLRPIWYFKFREI